MLRSIYTMILNTFRRLGKSQGGVAGCDGADFIVGRRNIPHTLNHFHTAVSTTVLDNHLLHLGYGRISFVAY